MRKYGENDQQQAHRGYSRSDGCDGNPLPRREAARPGDPLGIHDLTPRERQVLLLLGQAATNREISHSLGIAERTVKSHLTSVMGKLDVTTRTEAAIFSYVHHSALVHEEPDATAS
ncbi:helix-turn-helix transcriptional regulator [Streptomyces cavourensis]